MKPTQQERLAEVFFFSLVLLSFTGRAFGQTTGTLRGIVMDPSGAVIPGAPVSAIQQGTNVRRSTATDRDGNYEFPALAVGHYRLEIEASGFKKYVQRDIDVTLGHAIVIDS